MNNKTVTMAHGAGGKQTSELIDEVFKAHFSNPDLTADDAAVLPAPKGKIAMSTDGFIVSPAFFPGGNIGKLMQPWNWQLRTNRMKSAIISMWQKALKICMTV